MSRTKRSRSNPNNNEYASIIEGANLWLPRAIEGLWLTTAALVPILFGPPDSIMFLDIPKVALLRVCTGLMVILWVFEWAMKSRQQTDTDGDSSLWVLLKDWLAKNPANWIILAATFFLIVNVLSTMLSPAISVSLWGSNPGRDGFSLYNTTSYYVLFIVVATHLKTKAQLWRILGAVAFAATIVSFYGILQHYGIDPLGQDYSLRAKSSFGNSLFFASFLTMAIPISLGLGLAHTLKSRSLWIGAGWTFAIGIQIAAIVFTLSRGPWLGLAIAISIWLALLWLVKGTNTWVRGMAFSTIASILAVGIVLVSLSVNGDRTVSADDSAPTFSGQLSSRLSNPGSNLGQGRGLSGRIPIWERSISITLERPWFAFDNGSPKPFRYLTGYGPEMFLYTLPLEWNQNSQEPVNASAHNYPIHITVELGFLGLLALLSILIAVIYNGFQFARNRIAFEGMEAILLAALLASLSGRVVEQMLGVARISDQTLWWLVLGTLTAAMSIKYSYQQQNAELHTQRNYQETGKAWQWGIAVAVLVVGFAVVWQKNIPYIQAASLSSDSAKAYHERNLQMGIEVMDEAILTAPDVGFYYLFQAQMMNSIAPHNEVDELEIARAQHSLNLQALETNPLSHVARASVAESSLKLAQFGEDNAGHEAIRHYTELTQMLPGHQPAYNNLASAYLILGQPENAMAVLKEYTAFTNGQTELTSVFQFLKGVAHQEVGQQGDAIASLEAFLASDKGESKLANSYIAPAHRRLAELYEAIGQTDKRDDHRAIYDSLMP